MPKLVQLSGTCRIDGCGKDARVAIRTTRPRREQLRVTVYVDDRVAPASATRYCKFHGKGLINGLFALVPEDD